jgi:hypothetical protein
LFDCFSSGAAVAFLLFGAFAAFWGTRCGKGYGSVERGDRCVIRGDGGSVGRRTWCEPGRALLYCGGPASGDGHVAAAAAGTFTVGGGGGGGGGFAFVFGFRKCQLWSSGFASVQIDGCDDLSLKGYLRFHLSMNVDENRGN